MKTESIENPNSVNVCHHVLSHHDNFHSQKPKPEIAMRNYSNRSYIVEKGKEENGVL